MTDEPTDEPTDAAVRLEIRSPDGSAATVPIGGGSVTVGRRAPDHSPDVALGPDPQRWVGRVHCTLELVDGMWTVSDNQSVNGTLLRHGGSTTRLQGRKRVQHGDTLLIVGDMTDTGDPLYWELTFSDPHTTMPAPFGAPDDVRVTEPCLRYDWVAAQAYRCQDGTETLVTGLRPQGHQLLRHMVGRSHLGVALAFDHHELVTALWGDPAEWPAHRAYGPPDLAGVVRAVRRSIEADPSHPVILETVTGFGYRLHVHPDSADREAS